MTKKNGPLIPQLPQLMTLIKQPNRVTNARYDYTLLQQKALLIILHAMQESMDEQLKNPKTVVQLALFKSSDKSIELRLPLKSLTKKPSEYNELINTFDSLRKISIEFPYKDESGVNFKLYTGLIEKFALPVANATNDEKKKYRKEIIIWINKSLAERMVLLDGGYTKFHLEIALNAKCKYTPRIYQLMCKWKDKGGFQMKIEEFRNWLVLGDKHQDYKDLKKNILVPTHNELYQKADVWFEVDKVMDGKRVSGLKFKIITNETLKAADIQRDNVINMLRMHFSFTSAHIEEISYIINKPHLLTSFNNKLIELHDFLSRTQDIADVPAYTLKTLKNAFKNKA